MTWDNAPAIKAYAEERIRQLKELYPTGPMAETCKERIDELERIITLCDGLVKQAEFLSEAFKKSITETQWPKKETTT